LELVVFDIRFSECSLG